MATEVRPRPGSRWLGALVAPAVWLEKARGRQRLGLLVLYALVVGFFAFWFWWATSLQKLPDVGEPFDRVAYEAERVPEQENAFVLYKQAAERLQPPPVAQNDLAMGELIRGGWSSATPEMRRWVAENREALALWRRGTERPRSQPTTDEERIRFDSGRRVSNDLIAFNALALLEASRLQDEGDMAGAWGWYNAALRASRHVMMRGGFHGCSIGFAMSDVIQERIIPWCKDPRVDAALLRRALAEIKTAVAMLPTASEALKADYANLIWAIEHPNRWNLPVEPASSWASDMPWVSRLAAFVKREPERSRRVYQIVFGHWLAQCDRPVAERPTMVGEVRTEQWGTPSRYPEFPYVVPLSGLDATHPLPAEDLVRWLSSTVYARTLTIPFSYGQELIDRLRTSQGVLLLTVAGEAYSREHGEEAPSPEALVGPYLDCLPDGYNTEPDRSKTDSDLPHEARRRSSPKN